MDPVEQSVENFTDGYNCSQSVLSAFSADLGMELNAAVRVATAFGGGISRTGRLCGAVGGALMVIGLRYGNTFPTDRGAKEATYSIARRFMADFVERHGALECPALLNCEIGTPEGMQEAREKDLFKTQCPLYVETAARLLAGIKEREK